MYGPFSDGCILIAFLNVSPRFVRFSNSFYCSFFLQRFVDRCAVWRHCGGCRVAAAEVGSRSHHQRDDDIGVPRGSAARPPVSRSALQALPVRRLLSDSAPRVGGRLCRQLRTGPARSAPSRARVVVGTGERWPRGRVALRRRGRPTPASPARLRERVGARLPRPRRARLRLPAGARRPRAPPPPTPSRDLVLDVAPPTSAPARPTSRLTRDWETGTELRPA